MKKLLPASSTFRTSVGNIPNGPEFVRAAFHNMRGYHGDCQIRLALDSPLSRPIYRVEFFIHDEINGEEVAFPQPAAAFQGTKHRELTYDDAEARSAWSLVAMSYKDMKQLIGELRGLLPPP